MAGVLLAISTPSVRAQMFVNTASGTLTNSIPLQGNWRAQYIFNPSEFSGLYPGQITKLYFKYVAGTAGNYSNFNVKITTSSVNPLTNTAWYTTGFTTCLSSSSYSLTASGGWLPITLTTPFYWNATTNLVVEITAVLASGGYSIQKFSGSGGNRRAYGSSAASFPTQADALEPVFGLDIGHTSLNNDAGINSIDSPDVYCSGGSKPVYVTLRNFGKNVITSATVNWTVNGTAQTPYSFSGSLDTSGGTGPRSIRLNLGNYTFPATPVTIKAWTSTVNGTTDPLSINDSTMVVKQLSMNGTYTINPSGSGSTNFTSFAAAFTALQTLGVCAPVTFQVAAGTYSGQLIFSGAIPGASATNTVTFDGGNGNAATRIITHAGISTSFPTVIISDCPYLCLRNLTINATSTNYAFGVLINGNSMGDRVSKCIVNSVSGGSTGTIPIVIGGSVNSYTSGNGGNGVTIDSNELNNGYFNLSAYGSTASVIENLTVKGNTMLNAGQYGMMAYYNNGLHVLNNTIIPLATPNNSGLLFQFIYNSERPFVISGNRITNFGQYGLYLVTCNGNPAMKGFVTNNSIGGGIKTSNTYAVIMSNATNIAFANNSVNYDVTGFISTVSAVQVSGTSSDISFRNNLIATKGSGSLALPLYAQTTNVFDTCDYNVFYRQDTSDHNLIFVGSSFNTGNFKGGAGFNIHSQFADPGFENDTNLHINLPCLRGISLPYISQDLSGTARNSPPSVGAYEVQRGNNDVAPQVIVSPVHPVAAGTQPLKVRVVNYGANMVFSFNLSYTINNGTPVTQMWSGILNPCDTVTVVFQGGLSINVANGVNNLKVYTSAPNYVTDAIQSNDTITAQFVTAMGGTYVIGPAPSDYTTFGAAINDMQTLGIGGPIRFLVKSGTYNEVINLSPLAGTSATNSVHFTSLAGHRDSVTVNASGSYPLNLSGSYCSFSRMTFNQQSATTGGAIFIGGNIAYDTIYDCKLTVPNSSSINSHVIYASGYALSNVLIRRNLVQGGYFGLNLVATSSAYSTNCIIDSNVLQSHGYSTQLQYFSNLKFRRNTININTNNHYFLIQYANNGYEFSGNTVNASAGFATTMFLSYYCSGTAGNRGKISGNTFNATPTSMINLFAPYYYSSYIDFYNNSMWLGNGFIQLGYSSDNIRFYNNSISTLNASYALFHNESGCSAIDVKNNVVSNTGGGAALYWAGLPSGATYDYNNFYSTGSNIFATNSGGSSYANLATWRTASGMDQYSLVHQPGFTNPQGDLSPNTLNNYTWSLNGRGMPASWIGTDINGATRSTAVVNGATDIGAFEFTPTVLPTAAVTTPATPVASGTQYFTFGQDTIASLTWGATAPASAPQLALWSGSNHSQVNSSLRYMNAYWQFQGAIGSYNPLLTLYYKPNMLGTVPAASNLVIAQHLSGNNWGIASATRTLDTMKSTISAANFSSPATVTGVDVQSLGLSFNSISGTQSICSGNTPSQLTGSIPTGGSGSYSYKWMSTTDTTAGFTPAGGNDSAQNYTPASLTNTTWFRRLVFSSGFADTSAYIQVSVNPPLVFNSLNTGPGGICSGSSPGVPISSLNSVSGGDGTYTYLWLQASTSGGPYSPAASTNTTSFYTVPALTATTYYRRLVTSGGCRDTSAAWTMTVTPPITGNTLGSNQSILSGNTPAPLTTAAASGGTGSFTYNWLSSTAGPSSGFSPAGGTNNAQSYSPPALTANTWYKRVALSGSCSDTSAALGISVSSSVANNSISASQSICSGSIPAALTGTVPTGGTGTFTYQWLSSTTGPFTGYTAATGTSTSQGYSPGALTVTTWFRRYVVSGAATDTSLAVQITVPPGLTGNTINGAQTICTGGTPATLNGATPSGGFGSYSYSWLSSTVSSTAGFTATAGTSQNYTPSTLSATTWFKRVVSSGSCFSDTSASLAVTVSIRNVWNGTTSSAWATAGNWGCGRAPVTTDSVVIVPTSNQPIIVDAQAVKSITITSGSSLTLNNSSSQLRIAGSLTRSGSLLHTAGEIVFNGSSSQSIPAGTYHKLVLNNSAGASLSGAVTANNGVDLQSGKLTLGNYDLTVTGTTATVSAATGTYLQTNASGSLIIQSIGTGGRSSATFPVGASTYNPVQVGNSGTADAYSVRVMDIVSDQYSGSTPGTARATNAVNRTWIINEAQAGGSMAFVTLQWTASDELTGFDRSNCYVARYNGTAWLAGVAGVSGSASGSYTQGRAGITSFSPFGVGSNGALPVELISFAAYRNGNFADLKWTTAGEINNDHFTIERSTNGKDFTALTQIRGAGTFQGLTDYSYSDDISKLEGTVYYRLIQTDHDGTSTVSKTVTLEKNPRMPVEFTVYPNPSDGHITVEGTSANEGEVSLKVIDLLGRTVMEKNVHTSQLRYQSGLDLPMGVYTIQLSGAAEGISRVLVQ
jgi:hypothetical protein